MNKESINEPESDITLDQIKPGTTVKVAHIRGRGAARRRILDMGIVPGTTVKVIRKAPMGNPIEFEVKGYKLIMRKAEAELVFVASLV